MMEHNSLAAQYCLDVIRAVMQEQSVPSMPEGVTLGDLFEFSRLHGIEAIVYHGLSQLDVDEAEPTWASWGLRAEMLLTQSIVQLADRDALFEALGAANIPHMPVKGCWLKESYPQIDFRQMADLDVLIHNEDRARAKALMLSMGYSEDEEQGLHHDGYTKAPYTAVELHFTLIRSDSEYYPYYKNVWDKAKSVEGHTLLHRLAAEDEYIFYFVHLKKHMDEAGCGIRTVMDCTVYRRTYPDMDRSYLQGEFEKLGLSRFVQEVETLADCWFVNGEPLPPGLSRMGEEILWAGMYGSMENYFRQQMEGLRARYKNPLLRMAVYWLRKVFRPLWYMKHYYPILDKYPLLLPFTWLARIVQKCMESPAALVYQIKQIYKEGAKDA